jgi:hypothetical protein
MYVVELVPEDTVEIEGLKKPVLLFELQLTVPVGYDPPMKAVQVTGELTEAGLGEQ